MLLSDIHREGGSAFWSYDSSLRTLSVFPFSEFRGDRSNCAVTLFMVYRTKNTHREQRGNTNVKMGKKNMDDGRGRKGRIFFSLDSFEQCTMYGIKKKKEEEERCTAVIKTMAIHWMVFRIGETHEDEERERKFLVVREAARWISPHATGHGFFLSFFRSKESKGQCYVSSRDSCVSLEMFVHRFPRRESTDWGEFTWFIVLKRIWYEREIVKSFICFSSVHSWGIEEDIILYRDWKY